MNRLYFIFGIANLTMGTFVILSRFLLMPRFVELLVPAVLLIVIIVVGVLIFAKRGKSS